MKLRGYFALTVLAAGLIVGDVFQRFVVAPCVRLARSKRVSVLASWQQLLAWWVLTCARIGGARVPPPLRVVPGAPGHLLVMNHQSLFDIPLVIRAVDRGYPRIVTRTRYSRSIPTISHMVRLYQYPTVDPSAGRAEMVRMLRDLEAAARTSDVPMAIFPEGTRTRDGSLGSFRTAGLKRVLKARPWTVHVFVGDGFWRAARFGDLAGELGRVHGRMEYLGALEWGDPDADPEPLIEEMRHRMTDALSRLQAEDRRA